VADQVAAQPDEGGRGPARGYSWPPFEQNNQVSVRHGAYSPRRVDPLARELVDITLADPKCTYLAAPRWRPGVWAWARAEARVQLLTEWLADHGEGVDDEGNVAPVLAALRLWEVRAANARSRLGLDPLSAARLGRDVTAAEIDMARLLSGVVGPANRPAGMGLLEAEEVGDGDESE